MPFMQPPTGTVTFLFTDIEGSTKLWDASPDAMRAALALHDEILRASIEANGGYVFKTIGDAFCAAFPTAAEATAAAIDAQLSLSAESWPVAPPLRARMALHTGAADERGGDYFGQPVNRAARLLAAGHGGQTLVSAPTQELVRDALPAGCVLIDLGEASLKDLARSERVYQITHPGLASAFPPLKTLNSGEMPNNLPQQLTSFIGRDKELAEVKELLARSRLLTLVGAGGAGKTRLALQAAADLLDGRGDGVWLAELAPLSDPALVAGAVAQALGIKEAPGERIETTLLNLLKPKSLLLVLDNCEHILEACCSLATDILRHAPKAHILATSRAPLGTPGEQVYRVPNLSVPQQRAGASSRAPREAAYTAAALSQYDSVRLFVERAKAAQPQFAVTDANAPAVAQLCYRLDGIPLAIELAAARVRSMTVEQVNARLDARFKLLTGGSRMSLPRQQTLKALIDWSYDLLTAPEKSLFARLSVFAGGWTLEAAEAVCAGDGIDEWDALDLLTSLADKSLVVYDAPTLHDPGAGTSADATTDAGGGGRYRLLETIRQYAGERLAESGNQAGLQRLHRDWCVALAEQIEPRLTGPDATLLFTRLEAEHDNLRAALDASGLSEAELPGGVEAGLRLTAAVWRFWYTRGHNVEGRRWLEAALRRADERGNTNSAGSAGGAELARWRARALNPLGILAVTQGEYDFGTARIEEALEIGRRLDDRGVVVQALSSLGNIAAMQGDIATAYDLQRECVAMLRAAGDRWGVALSLANLANYALMQNDVEAAAAYIAESLTLHRAKGDRRGLAISLANSCKLAHLRGQYEAAVASGAESLTIAREIGDQLISAVALGYLSVAALSRGKYSRGTRLAAAAAALHERLGSVDEPTDATTLRDTLAEARAALGETAFDTLWSEGQALSWQQATDYALSDADER